MKLAFIGLGRVGLSLAKVFQNNDHEIIAAHDNSESTSILKAVNELDDLQVMSLQAAVNTAEVVLLAVPFGVAQGVLEPLQFGNKILIDCTNPVGSGLTHALNSQISGAEKVQQWAGDARVVKAYSVYGFEVLANAGLLEKQGRPVMPIAGDHPESKMAVAQLNLDLGFDTLDIGDLSQALHMEHMTLLWVSMVRKDKHSLFAWSVLER